MADATEIVRQITAARMQSLRRIIELPPNRRGETPISNVRSRCGVRARPSCLALDDTSVRSELELASGVDSDSDRIGSKVKIPQSEISRLPSPLLGGS